jgi:hypothetical protein
VQRSVRLLRRSLLAGTAAACALAGSIAVAGPASSQPSFSCQSGSEQSPTQAYINWQDGLIHPSSAPTPPPTAPPAAASSQPEWLASFDSMTTDSTTGSTAGQNWFTWNSPTGKDDVLRAFTPSSGPSGYVMESSADQVANSSGDLPGDDFGSTLPTTVQVYKSAWDLISALDPGAFGGSACGTALYSDVRAVLYDDEDWTGTPAMEQQYPGYYVAMIAYYVHQYNLNNPSKPLKFFVAPSFDLSSTIPHSKGSGAAGYLADDIPELVSTPSTTWRPDQGTQSGTDGNFGTYVPGDVDIQAQQDEPVVKGSCSKPPLPYPCIVQEAANQIAMGDSGASLFAGLTTNNTGGTGEEATVAQLEDAAATVKGIVSGFWLNDPEESKTTCPKCSGPYPNIADPSLNGIDTNW